MKQIVDWLEKLGLGRYAQCFAENDADLAVVGDVIDHDLFRSPALKRGDTLKCSRSGSR